MIRNMTFLGKDKDMRKHPRLGMFWIRDHEVDISIKAISNALFRNIFDPIEEDLEYYV